MSETERVPLFHDRLSEVVPTESCESAAPAIDLGEAQQYIEGLRGEHGGNVLLMVVKDQNRPGKLCFSGAAETSMYDAIQQVLQADEKNASVKCEKDEYDSMYDVVFRNTIITTGYAMLSLAKSYFPRGQLLVQLLDTIASHGWMLAAALNFGGEESRMDWPVFIFYMDTSETQARYSGEHMFWAVKDSNTPGKLCAAGPVGDLEAAITQVFHDIGQGSVKSEKDSYDEDYDVVWRETSITSGMSTMSFAKAYFPKGKVCAALLEQAAAMGWQVMACPNFGAQGDYWPCFVFRQLKNPRVAPTTVFGSIKASNVPGKLCISGPGVPAVQDALLAALRNVEGNGNVKFEKDSYDDDHDIVIHNVKITTGMGWTLAYFPRCDSIMAILEAMQQQGYSVTGCPNFGGMNDTWPTFIWEKNPNPTQTMHLAVKDDSAPGKMYLGGAQIEQNHELAAQLLEALQTYGGPKVVQTKESNTAFGICYKNTKLTTGSAFLSFAKPYFPHGYPIEAVLMILRSHGWVAVGGPHFGNDGSTWPSIVFQKNVAEELSE